MNALVPIAAPPVPVFTMPDMERVALAIAKGGLFGSSDPNAVLTLCMLAQAEGQHPAVVFRDYHIISGKPAKKAEAMQRDFLSAGGKIEWHQLTDDIADATFTHPLGGSARITWDKARVAQAQLVGNAMHKKYPRQMLRSRVISEGVRTVFPGATSGLYESGEVQDMVVQDGPARPAAPEPQRARDLQREEAKALPEPAQDERPARVRQSPADWAGELIERIKAAPDAEALMAIQTDPKTVRALAKLEAQHVDLHTRVVAAGSARLAELQPPAAADEDDGDMFGGGDDA